VRLRYRIDGILIDGNLPPEAKLFLLPILSRIKIMSNLSITEKRLPQDGSTVVRTNEQDLDLRISTIPTPRGESMVIRILPTKSMRTTLESLGFNEYNAKQFRNLITKSHGIVFVTGPTGSGKTTTLYACLNELNRDEHKIITIEDPIEYEMEGITQIQINTRINFSFAEGLRSILRHDPDIIMVGEVRDLETAEIAIRTALTGHLVFSTLHTNDAASGISRLIDMGVEPYLVASSVEAFVAQRLVRLICPQCKIQDNDIAPVVREEIARSLSLPSMSFKIYKGRGCDHCNGTGFFGRTAIYEILPMNERIRALLSSQPSVEAIKKAAIASGMQTLRQNGWQCVFNGLTTPSEVMYVAGRDNLDILPIPILP
jgi:type II secretory ATPase GspE/PulE/Tfp pilus assembly ATPase PilB-like protein